MQSERKLGVAIVGCGNIGTRYAVQILTYPECTLLGFNDIDPTRAENYAAQHGGKVYPTLDDVLADKEVDIVVNLTIHFVHYEVIKKCLEAGKHVHTEKPFAMDMDQAKELVQLAESKGLRLSSAPITYMGEAQQAAWKLLRDGKAGKVRVAYAEVNHGRIESWHPNPEPFYEVGPLWDVGIYPLTLLTAFLGPVREIVGHSKTIFPDRVTMEDRKFTLKTPDFYLAMLTFADGTVARLTANFYVKNSPQGGTLEFHGDAGTVLLGNFQSFNAAVHFSEFGEKAEEVVLKREAFRGIEFGRGLEDLARSILDDVPHRADASHACHVIEIICGILESAKTGEPVKINSDFRAPEPMPWADKLLA